MSTVSIDVDVAGRRGRIFATDTRRLESAVDHFRAEFMDETDVRREPSLRVLIERGGVAATAHPSVDSDDIVRVYLRPIGGGAPLFACVLVSRTGLETMLREAPLVFEGFALQVVDSRQLSSESTELIQTAVQAWIDRNYPGLAPMILVESWRESLPEGASAPIMGMALNLDDLPLAIGTSGAPRKEAA